MKQVLIGGVTATIVGEENLQGKEAMLALLVHGRTRSQEDSLKFAHILQKSVPHLVCVTWDLPNHGTRLTDTKANDAWDLGNALHMLQMQAIINQGSVEAADILAMIPAQLQGFNVTKRVIIGVSLGGYVAWNVAVNYTHLLTAAIPIITSPDLLAVMHWRWDLYVKAEPEQAAEIKSVALDEEVVKKMEEDTRKARELRKSSLPLLAICGADDPLVPAKFTIEWGKNASPHQRVEVVPGVKHEVPREIIDLTAEYLISILTRV